MTHKDVERAFDEIDAAIFSSDTFLEVDALARLKSMVSRWSLQIPRLEQMARDTAAWNASVEEKAKALYEQIGEGIDDVIAWEDLPEAGRERLRARVRGDAHGLEK